MIGYIIQFLFLFFIYCQVKDNIFNHYSDLFRHLRHPPDKPEKDWPLISEVIHPRTIQRNRLRTYWRTFFYTTVGAVVMGLAHFGSDGSYCVSQDMYGCYEYEYDDNFVPSTFDQSLMFTMILYPKLLIASMLGARQGIWVKESFEYED